MTGVEWILLGLVLLCGFYAAWNIGANDVANAMGTSVGSGALSLKHAVILAAIFEFLGALIVGSNVSETVRKGIFDPEKLTGIYGEQDSLVLGCGMIAALMAAGTWLMIATYFRWPVSTTHSIVGAVVGFGCTALGFELIEWSKVGMITAGWVVSPMISGVIAYVFFSVVLKQVFFKRNPVRAAKQVAPALVFLVLVVLIGVTAYKGLKPLWPQYGIDPFSIRSVMLTSTVAIAVGAIGFIIAYSLLRDYDMDVSDDADPLLHSDVERSLGKALVHLRRVEADVSDDMKREAETIINTLGNLHEKAVERTRFQTDSVQLQKVEKIFVFLQVITACFVAFAHGANDVANAIGPLSAAYQAIRSGKVALTSGVPLWALALGGVGIVVGLATWGWRVIRTVGERITELTPSRGFCAEFAAALTILLASVLPIGLPVSTTHTLVGAVLGVGFARGIGALNLKTMRNIVASWAITIPAGAVLSVTFYFLLKLIFIGSTA